MKLYVCWGTFHTPRPGGHPCHNAYEALKEAGWDRRCRRPTAGPPLGDALNPTAQAGPRPDRQNWVPVLVTDEDEVVQGSHRIVDWAKANPKTASDAA